MLQALMSKFCVLPKGLSNKLDMDEQLSIEGYYAI